MVASARAAITVNTTADPGAAGQCSLRKAIQAASTQAGGGDCAAADPLPATTTINLPAGHYTLLAQSQLEIAGTAKVIIQGGSVGDPTATVIDGGHYDRVLMVDSGAVATLDSVTVTGGLTANGTPGSCCTTKDFIPNSGFGGTNGVDGGGIYNAGALTLTDSIVTGNASGAGGAGGAAGAHGTGGDGGSGGNGGGIDNFFGATLILTNTIVSNNATGAGGAGGQGGNGATGQTGGMPGAGGRGGYGGGIVDYGHQVTLTNSALTGNTTGPGASAGGSGKGAEFFNGGGGQQVSGGEGGSGGGIYSQGVQLTVTASTISGNALGSGGQGGNGGDGGAGAGSGGNASNGGSGGSGGAIALDIYTPLTLTNSTLADNTTGVGGAGGNGGSAGPGSPGAGGSGGNGGYGGSGGAIRTNTGTFSYTTIAGNRTAGGGLGGSRGQGCFGSGCESSPGINGSAGVGAGILVNGTPGMTMRTTLIASNATPGGVQNCSANPSTLITDGGYNLSFGDATCPGINGDPVLGLLQNNGGPSQTMALGAGSAAINQIPGGVPGCPGVDQRGVARPFPASGLCDVGAFEAEAVTHTLTVSPSGSGTVTSSPSGINCGSTCSASFTDGTMVALTANAAPGSTFSGWSGGGCSGTGKCSVTVNSDQTVTARFDVASGGGIGGGGKVGGPTAPGGGIAPTVGRETLSPAAFRAAPSGPDALAAKGRFGSKVSYSLDKDASVRFAVAQRLPGRRAHGSCVKPTTATRKAPACTRLAAVPGGFTVSGFVGANSFRFTGRLTGHKLTPGTYELEATPSANGLVGRRTSASFQIVK